MWTRLPARRVPCGATPSTETERMNPTNAIPDITTFYIQETGALLFGLVFWFLYRQSRAVYFGLWAVAWGLRLLAAVFSFELIRTADTRWLAPYATFEFAFVIVLIS